MKRDAKIDPQDLASWESLQVGNSVFQGDLGLVKHPNETRILPIHPPHDVGRYSLTDWSLTEAQFKYFARGGERKGIVLVVGCMDARYARPLYDYVIKHESGKFVITQFMAAGVAQSSNQPRMFALNRILSYVVKNSNVIKIYVSGHLHNCGGLAHLHYEGNPVCATRGWNPGGTEETRFVAKEIMAGRELVVPEGYGSKTQMLLVTEFNGKPTVIPFKTLQNLGL